MMEYSFKLDTLFNTFLAFQSNNVGNTKITGVDLSVAGEGRFFGLPTTLLAGYTYIKPLFKEFDLSGKDLPIPLPDSTTTGQINAKGSSADFNILKYRSKHNFKFDLESRYKKFSLGVAAIYNSNIDAVDEILNGFIPGVADYREQNNKGYKTVDLRLAYYHNEHLKISLIGANILNEEYMTRPGEMEAPRSYALRLDYTL